MLFSSFTAPAGNTVVLKTGTMVGLELINEVTSDMKAGQTVDFRVTNDVKADGVVVIPAGSVAKGQIISASKNQLLGIQGDVTVQVKSVNAIDGTKVALSSSSFTSEGNNKIVTAIVLTVLCFFGFLLKGGDGLFLANDAISMTEYHDINVIDAVLEHVYAETAAGRSLEYKTDGRVTIIK
jgi:hypothetical protein